MGIIVKYENKKDTPQWVAPRNTTWDYTAFGSSSQSCEPAETVPLVFRRKFAGNNWVDHRTINNKEYPETDPILVRANTKYRLRFDIKAMTITLSACIATPSS